MVQGEDHNHAPSWPGSNWPESNWAARKQVVLQRVSISELVERHVKLSGSAGTVNRRGRCPFHNGNSASFSVKSPAKREDGFAHCFGCSWHGNAIDFMAAIMGWDFKAALAELERECGLGGDAGASSPAGSGPIRRERVPAQRRERQRQLVEPIDMARAIWRRARPELSAVRRYFMGRGVPEWVMPDARLAQFRFLGACPISQWEIGTQSAETWPRDALNAPAIVAMVRRPQMLESPTGPVLDFVPAGLHVTYLNPDGTGTMVRRKPWAKADDPDPLFPKRKMLGPVGHGAVILGEWHPQAPLFVGEGNETVLSGMALADAPSEAVGIATLSLDNLQGAPRKWTGGIWPLFRIEPDPEGRALFHVPGQRGPVRVLVDSDMAPLKSQKVVERKGGPIIERAITGAERARICAELAVKGWRAAGASDVQALRAPLGMDFNDAIQAEEACRG